MNEKLQFIREKCTAANPEILRLKFGCFVVAKGELRMITQECIGGFKALTIIEDEGDMVYAYPETFYQKDEMRIVGRPIRLADVLLALRAAGTLNFKVIVKKDSIWEDHGIKELWNLRADDLEQQSEETISFLYELLK